MKGVFQLYNYCKADLYLTNLMLDHVQLIQKTLGRQIDIDYMIGLEHITYQLDEISEETKCAFPEIDWTCIDKLREFVAYEARHFKLGDVIETVSEDILTLSKTLPLVRDELKKRLESR